MNQNSRRAVFLDRDGVINQVIWSNQKAHPPKTPKEVLILSGVPQALQTLKDAGFLLLVITNQPDVARGTLTHEAVEAIHAVLLDTLPIDAIYTCYHDDQDQCDCRKPQPGMLLQASSKYSVDLASSFVVGDRWKDIEAGQRAGCKTIRIQQPHTDREPSQHADHIAESLKDAVPWILDQSNKN